MQRPAFQSSTPDPDINGVSQDPSEPNQSAAPATADAKVVNLAYYRIKKSLKEEGFDLVSDENGKLKLVLRVPRA